MLTRELYKDMQARVPDLRYEAQNQIGTYFASERFEKLGVKQWRTASGNGWEFPRLADLREDWERRQGGWKWPNKQVDWEFNPDSVERALKALP